MATLCKGVYPSNRESFALGTLMYECLFIRAVTFLGLLEWLWKTSFLCLSIRLVKSYQVVSISFKIDQA